MNEEGKAMKKLILAMVATASLGLPQATSAGFHYPFAPMLVIHRASPVIADASPADSLPVARHEERVGRHIAIAQATTQSARDATDDGLSADMPEVAMTGEEP
jgi:hypothetical protein